MWLCGDRERLRMDGCLRMCVIRENGRGCVLLGRMVKDERY